MLLKRSRKNHLWLPSALIASLLLAVPLTARNNGQDYGAGLTMRVPVTEQQLLQAVEDVVADGIIQGTKEYNKDEYISGAEEAQSSSLFPRWTGPGKVFFKVKKNALDPRNFKNTNDAGTLAVRYIVQPADEKSAIVKIDALFVDDLHLREHLSNGSVENAEFKDIQDHLAAMQLKKKEAAEEEQRHQQELAAQQLERKRKQNELDALVARAPDESLTQHVARLRSEVERIVKAPGAQLKSAPFKSASSLQSMPAGAHVAILISTPYWYGVETEDGKHGWIHRSQLELLP